jgi:peptidoglycan/LPS O-acetylase OafA/YrhL
MTTQVDQRVAASSGSTKLGYIPSLDGIRGVAVALVFLFHAGFEWASGGFLGVSVFFTLSGFLITNLLLNEGLQHRSIDALRFWSRRFRRLLPASLVTVAFVLILSATAYRGDPAALRGDALAALGYVANWRFLFAGHSYADLFRAPSPLLHFWSLAVEEQFYLLFPIAVLLVRRASSTRRSFHRNLRTTLLCCLGISVATSVIAGAVGNGDFVYYSLPTRGAEILIGALVATSLSATRLVGRRQGAWPVAVGVSCLGAIVFLCATATTTTSWVTSGGLPVFALLSAGVLVSALPNGPFASVLAVGPLRSLGRISYGVYLYHWPVILWLTPDRVGTTGVALAAVQAAVTLAIATASYHLLELPVRQGRLIRGAAARVAVPAALVVACAVAVGTTVSLTRPPLIDFSKAASALGPASPPPTASAPATPGPPRVEFIGDSTALETGGGVDIWGRDTGRMTVLGWSNNADRWIGCGVVQVGEVRYDGRVFPARQNCGDRIPEWGSILDATRPDAVVLQFGPWDAADHRLPGDTTWRAPGDPVYDAKLLEAMIATADVSLARGIPTIWLTSPHIDMSHENVPAGTPLPEGDPPRMDRVNSLLREVAQKRPLLHLIDLARYIQRWPGGEYDPALRPDGVHFTWSSARIVANWLGPAIERASVHR